MINTLLKITRQYGEFTFSKFRISRAMSQSTVIFLKNQATVADLFSQIRLNFPIQDSQHSLLASNTFQPGLLGSKVMPQAHQSTKQLKQQCLIPLLLQGQLFIYQAKSNNIMLCYGIQIDEFCPTNNRNLPQNIANGIVQLAIEWQTAKTLGDAIKPVYYNAEDKNVIEERQELKVSMQKSINSLMQLKQLKKSPYVNKATVVYSVRTIALMTLNWGFLFGVTYGKYGWDVGEPLSYLTTIGVDLIALSGLFDLQQQLKYWLDSQYGEWSVVLNLQAQHKMQSWLLSYYRRQLY